MISERQERVAELFERLVNFNRQRLDWYYELGLDVQRNFGLNDYVDIHANLVNKCRNIDEKKNDIYLMPDNELATLEQILLETARVIGVNTSDINCETNCEAVRNYFPAFDPHNRSGPCQLLAAFGMLDNEGSGYRMILTKNDGQDTDFNRTEQFVLGLLQVIGGIIGLLAFCVSSGFAIVVGIIGARNIIEGITKCATAIMGVEYRGTLTEIVHMIGQTLGWSNDLTEKLLLCADIADTIISGGLSGRFAPKDIKRLIRNSGFFTDGPSVINSIRNLLSSFFPASSITTDTHTSANNGRRRMSIQERYDYYLNFDTSWGPGARREKNLMKASLLRDIEELLLELDPNDYDYLRAIEIMNRLLAE